MPLYTIEVIEPGFDAESARFEADAPREAALAWARKKGPEWSRALPWNGKSPKDFRLVEVFVHETGRVAVEFAVVFDSGHFSVAEAP